MNVDQIEARRRGGVMVEEGEPADWAGLERFLTLGAEAGTYHASEGTASWEEAREIVRRCLERDGGRIVDRVVELSREGVASGVAARIFVLALATMHGGEGTNALAYASVARMCGSGKELYPGVASLPALLETVEAARTTTRRDEIIRLITERSLPRDGVPVRWLGEAGVWEALLEGLPMAVVLGELGFDETVPEVIAGFLRGSRPAREMAR